MKTKLTKNQEYILNLLRNSQGHMTAEQIHFALKEEGEAMGIATIYRNLNALYTQSLINRVRHPDLGFIYDKNIHEHYHFHCQICNKVEDVNIPYQSDLNGIVEKDLACKVAEHGIVFEGICKECLEKKKN